MIQTRNVSVKLKNGKIITAHYTRRTRDVVVYCDDLEFFGSESIEQRNIPFKQAPWDVLEKNLIEVEINAFFINIRKI